MGSLGFALVYLGSLESNTHTDTGFLGCLEILSDLIPVQSVVPAPVTPIAALVMGSITHKLTRKSHNNEIRSQENCINLGIGKSTH